MTCVHPSPPHPPSQCTAGGLDRRLPIPPLREQFWSTLGAFLGIMAVSAVNRWVGKPGACCLSVGTLEGCACTEDSPTTLNTCRMS
jgi:hypothetical protein